MASPHSRGAATEVFSGCPPGARIALKDYSNKEAVRSRGYDLVSTYQCLFNIRTKGGNENIIFFRYLNKRVFGCISFRYVLHLQVLLIRAAGS